MSNEIIPCDKYKYILIGFIGGMIFPTTSFIIAAQMGWLKIP